MRSSPLCPILLALVIAGALALVTPARSQAIVAHAPSCDRALPAPEEERTLMSRVRHLRQARHLSALRGHRGLARVARSHSRRLARGEYLQHSSHLPFQGFRAVGQNLARGMDAGVVLDLMLGSPPHRRALLSPDYDYLGVGAAVDCRGVVTYTLNLAALGRG